MTRSARRGGAAILVATAFGVAALGVAACSSSDPEPSVAPSATQVGTKGSTTSAPGSAGSTAPGTSARPRLRAVTAATVDQPVDLVVRPGDDHLWLAERAGVVRRLSVGDGGASLRPDRAAALDITDQTSTESERGLLGIAFSADGSTLFTSYTNLDGDTRLDAYAVRDDEVDVSSRRVLLAVDQPYPNHNGGQVRLGPDGKLWLGLGDGGAANDPENNAQDPRSLLGKVVRLDPTGGEPEIVLSGVRNPWRFSFDTDGSLWIGDVGQNQWEEVDHLPAARIVGANLGWSALEGTHQNRNVDPDGRGGTDPVAPVFEYSHDGGNCSITGGFVYRGSAIPALRGAYLFADYCAGWIRALRLDDQGALAAEYDLGISVQTPVSFSADADGEPYVLSGQGTIVRLVDATP